MSSVRARTIQSPRIVSAAALTTLAGTAVAGLAMLRTTSLDSGWLPLAAGIGVLSLAALLRPVEPVPGQKFTLAGSINLFGALVLPGEHAVVALGVAALAAKSIQRATVLNATVNTARAIGAAGAASLVLQQAGGASLVGVAAASMAYFGYTLASVAVMIAADRDVTAVRSFFAREAIPTLALTSVGAAASMLWTIDPLALLFLVPPLAMIELAARAGARERVAREARERAFEAQRTFAANAAHEIRTPLAALEGNLAYLRGAALPKDEAAALGDALRDAARMGSLVDRLLMLARYEHGERVVPGHSEAAEVAQRAVEATRVDRTEVARVLDVPPGLFARIPADLLEAVLRDLLANAAQYTERGRIELRARRDGSTIELSVSDTGIGIPSDEIPRVFDRFFRGAQARQMASGTGLGLAIVREIVTSYGGSIELSSERGRGTTVRVRLPAAGPPPRAETERVRA